MAAPPPLNLNRSAGENGSPMPSQLLVYIEELKAWAAANQRDARNDSIKFWSLKGPAILVASSSGLLATMHLPVIVSVVLGLIGGLCVALDGILRPGALHTTHIRAVHDLLNLADAIATQWNIADLSGKESRHAAAEILDNAEKKKQQIAGYLKAEESDTLREENRKG
jgi:hypothetical protein